jgi:uncharacterized protein (TIGR03437 family)
VIGGSLYSVYLANGGFAGALGYPASDAVGGAQRFTSGAALGGTPVRVVPALVAAKWFQLGGAAGLVGPPVADPVTSLSSGGVGVLSQNFAGGTLFGIANGSRTGQAFFSSGPILTRYLALSGPAGPLGAPASDVIPSGQAATETFENGFIDLQPGASSAIEHLNPRHPAITATPSSVTPGGRIHISASGFAPGATLAFTITGQPGFSVAAASGAFAWDLVIPLGATPGTVSISTTVQGSSDSAAATYSITSVPASRPVLTIVSGDRQTGLPGSALALPIIALLQDSAGNPLQGVPVAFDSSPGASAQSSFVTGPDGEVSVGFRLPLASGVAVGSLKAGAQVANFSAIATSGTIGGFPVFTQSDAHGAFVAGLASLIRYFQNAGLLPAPNGLATPAALNQFLVPGSGAPEISNPSIVNPWIAAKFALAGVFVESTALDHVRDLINSGSPVAILLNLAVDGTVSGGTTVDAIGISDDGSIIIEDPNPSFGRSSLNDYLNGFSAQGHQIVGVAAAVLRIGTASLPASAMPFTISSPIQAGAAIASPAGMCSLLDVPDGERFQYCDGVQAKYELDFTTPLGAGIVDLTGGPGLQVAANGGVSWALARDVGQLKIAPQVLTVDAVTDSAAFTAGLSPGGLITLFGSGFGSAAGTTVTLDGAKLPVLAAFPFQINTQIPPGAASGSAQLQVSGALGTASKSVTVLPWAPGIFTIGAQGATINQDGSLNSASTPAQRGQYISVYCSGLGATAPQGGLQWTATTVTAMVNGASLIPSFSGLAPGFIGVYQVNVTIPANSPPSLAGTLAIRENGQNSNSVPLALQ